MGIDRSTYSYYELGKIKPDVKTVMQLAKIFDVHYTDILESEGEERFSDSALSVKNLNERSDFEPVENVAENSGLTLHERNMLLAFRLLSERSKSDILEFISEKFKKERGKSN